MSARILPEYFLTLKNTLRNANDGFPTGAADYYNKRVGSFQKLQNESQKANTCVVGVQT